MKYFLFLLFILCFPATTFSFDAKEIDKQAKHVATLIKQYVEARPLTERFPLYSEIRSIMSEKLGEIPHSESAKRQLYKDIAFYHNNNIVELVYYISSRPWAIERFIYWQQDEISAITSNANKIRTSHSIDNTIRIISSKNEFTDGENIYKMHLGTFKEIKESELEEHLQLPGDTIYKEWIWYIYSIFGNNEKKIPFTEILAEWWKKMLLYNDSYFIEDGSILTYQYDEFFPIESYYGIYESELEANWYSYDEAVILRLQDAKNNITFSPNILKVANEDDFDMNSEFHHELINTSIRDVLLTEKDYSKELKDIYNLAQEITRWLTSEDDKILAIYDWVNKNIVYPRKYDAENILLGSWVETYLNKEGLCIGQTRLMLYLLKAAEIENVKPIAWYVVDSFDFPQVWHAWIQIWDYFYDPSFEREYQQDPSKYLYYKIPYDIIYTNRYNLKDLPKKLLVADKDEIKKEIKKRRLLLTEKYYPSDKYMLLQRSYFVKKYSLEVEHEITLSDIIHQVGTLRIDFKDWSLIQKYDIFDENITYFNIPSLKTNLEEILQNINYDVTNQKVIEIYRDGEISWYWLAQL